jgi:outer membrane protein OmpA-like peptidoglycan-associated protein
MVKNYLLLILMIPVLAAAQVEDERCLPPSKKVVKLIDAGREAKDTPTAVGKFKEAIEMADDNAMAYFEFGMFAYNSALEYYKTQPNPMLGDKNFKKAEEMFLETIERCPDYHADCYYLLGVINYTQQDKLSTIKWFKKFLEFKSSDVKRYPEDFAKKESDVKEVLSDLEFENQIKTEEVPFEPSIVPNVSSSTHEYFPMISPDNEVMYYTRVVDRNALGDGQIFKSGNIREEFYFSKRPDIKSLFDDGNPESAPFNDGSVESYGAATLAVDNKEMIFCACKTEMVNTSYGPQKYKNCDLYSTTYKTGDDGKIHWTPFINLGPAINSPDGWEGQPSLSADGKTLYFTAYRPTTRNNDIFVANRKPDGSWGEAMPFEHVNTDGKDKSPFLHQDSETLYFVSQVSDTRKGVGGLDIFYIRKDEKGNWTEPKNIGYPINSEADELGIFVSIDGEIAYYSSSERGDWNIYSFELYQEARPQSVAIVKGDLKDQNGDPVKDATIEIAYEGSDEVTEVKVNGDDGKFAAIVKTSKPQDVMVTVKKEGSAFDSKVIAKEEIKEMKKDPKNVKIQGTELNVKELKVGEAYTINDILYATNSFELNQRSKFILKGFARFLKENPTISVLIQGHTDDVGDDNKNTVLSDNRAKGVKAYLASQGVASSRLKAKGYGETDPKVPNTSSSNRAKNRRTDFVIEGM